jgi:ribosomal protein L11 methylase PrmA
MEDSLTQKIRSDFDRIALSDQAGWNHNNHYHRFLIKQLPIHCKTALDIGCGTGDFSWVTSRVCWLGGLKPLLPSIYLQT